MMTAKSKMSLSCCRFGLMLRTFRRRKRNRLEPLARHQAIIEHVPIDQCRTRGIKTEAPEHVLVTVAPLLLGLITTEDLHLTLGREGHPRRITAQEGTWAIRIISMAPGAFLRMVQTSVVTFIMGQDHEVRTVAVLTVVGIDGLEAHTIPAVVTEADTEEEVSDTELLNCIIFE